ncbi:MAG: hypothetical protein QOF52_2243 [Propionibacteriaceae bacterium]|nr:hypothetical protein [Propionibacteriaceae bacterium]
MCLPPTVWHGVWECRHFLDPKGISISQPRRATDRSVGRRAKGSERPSNNVWVCALVAKNVPTVLTTEPATGLGGLAISPQPSEWTYNDLNTAVLPVGSLPRCFPKSGWPIGIRIADQDVSFG